MLDFDDLLAARILSKQDPTLRSALLRLLADLRDGPQRGLLEIMASRRVLSGEQQKQTRQLMSRYKRGRALGIFVHLLTERGLQRAQLEVEAKAIGDAVNVVQLGKALVAKGLLAQELNRQLQFQARVVFDGDHARQLREHLASTPIRPTEEKIELDLVGSERFNIAAHLPRIQVAQLESAEIIPPQPSPQEMEEIVSSSSAGFDEFLRPPAFNIPDWVDTSVLTGGMFMVADYRILGQIGKGGMGTVYLVHSLLDHETATALKVLKKGSSEEAVARFKREALTASLFEHVNVINVLAAGEEHGQHYMAMEFFDGVGLDGALKARGRFPWGLALQLMRQLLLGLGAAHEAKVVHRDVKPSNVLVSRNLQSVRLTDFGIATVMDLGGLEDRVFKTTGAGLIGTPRYMSPEQASGEDADPRSDLYSVGLILYELLTQAFPFNATTPTEILTSRILADAKPLPADLGVPPGVHTIVNRLLAKEANDRFATAEAVVAEIDTILPGGRLEA